MHGLPAKMFKRDAFNFGDLLCYDTKSHMITAEKWLTGCKRECITFADMCRNMEHYARVKQGIALVQTTSRSNQSERIKKIRDIIEAEEWLRVGRIFVHGWAKRGPRGGRKVWEVQVTELGTEDENKITAEEAPLFVRDDDF